MVSRTARFGMGAAAAVSVLLTSCSSTVSGTAGSPTAAPTGTASGSLAPPTGAASAGASAPPPHTVPAGAFARTPVRTRHGDPVLIDWCMSLGSAYLAPTGLTASQSSLQNPSSCGWSLKKGNAEKIGLIIIVEDRSVERMTLPPVQSSATADGFTVKKFAFTGGVCARLMQSPTFDVLAEGIASGTSSPQSTCQATDLGVARFARVNAQSNLPMLPVPTPSFSDYDLCTVARAVRPTSIPHFGTAKFESTSFGTTCSVQAKDYLYTLESARVSDLTGHVFDKTTRVGTHTFQASGANTHLACDFADIGPKIAGTHNTHEELDLSLKAHYGSAQLCGQVAKFFGALLDRAGIR